jgi:hypothetical protein
MDEDAFQVLKAEKETEWEPRLAKAEALHCPTCGQLRPKTIEHPSSETGDDDIWPDPCDDDLPF